MAAAKRRKRTAKLKNAVRPYLMILPAMAGIFLFCVYPALKIVHLSLFKYNMLNPMKTKYIGAGNYANLFQDAEFYKVLQNTGIYTLFSVVLSMVLAVLLAIWICDQKSFMNRIVQTGLFTPHIISMVSVALIWMWMMDPQQGFLNFVLRSLGLPESQWLSSSGTALMCVILVTVWKGLGYQTLMVVSALQGIPKDILEAAELDNATGLRLIWKIKIPLISPQLFLILITMTIGSFKVFDSVQIMTAGGPNNATNTIVYYLFQFRESQIGYASAIGVVLMALVGLLTFLYFKLLSDKVHYA